MIRDFQPAKPRDHRLLLSKLPCLWASVLQPWQPNAAKKLRPRDVNQAAQGRGRWMVSYPGHRLQHPCSGPLGPGGLFGNELRKQKVHLVLGWIFSPPRPCEVVLCFALKKRQINQNSFPLQSLHHFKKEEGGGSLE